MKAGVSLVVIGVWLITQTVAASPSLLDRIGV